MKKLFAIFAIAGIVVACGNNADKKIDAPEDSVNRVVDSTTKTIEKATDSANKMLDTVRMK